MHMKTDKNHKKDEETHKNVFRLEPPLFLIESLKAVKSCLK